MSLKKESCAFLNANRKITFCGCDNVEKYGECEIELKLCDMSVAIRGQGLSLSTFAGGEISVTGAIEAVELLKKGGKGNA